MKKILSLYYRPKPGGFCKRLTMAYEAFAEQGWEVHYLSLEEFSVRHANIHHHKIPMPFKKREDVFFWLNFFVVSVFALARAQARLAADAIVVFGPFYSFIAAPCRLFRKARIILFSRGELLKSLAETRTGIGKPFILMAYRWVRRIGYQASDAIIFNSKSLAEKAKKEFPSKKDNIAVLLNDIPPLPPRLKSEALAVLKKEFSLGDHPFILISVGRLHPGKNLEFLLRIFFRVLEKTRAENMFLFIVGDDPLTGASEKAKLASLIDARGRDRVFVTGWRSDVDAFYAAADIFLIPSRHEGSPNSLLEALGYDLICLGSTIEEIREILDNDELVFSLDDAGLEKAANSMIRFYQEEDYRRHLQSICSGIKRRLTFDWKKRLCQIVDQTPKSAGP
jgi:glycosyltransferase involved in cell wall biosynthesis